MRRYKSFAVQDFVKDLRFRTWVQNPSPEEELVWQQWLSENPHLDDIVQEARAIVLAIHPFREEKITDDEIHAEIRSIMSRVEAEDDADEQDLQRARSPFLSHLSPGLKIAASLLIVALAGWFGYGEYSNRASEKYFSREVAELDSYLVERINKSAQPILINLPDKSSVLLSQNSLIRYPKEFTGTIRSVFLKGNAFFEVTKDDSKPFYVEAGQIVAKVLGTSFEIDAKPENKEVKVTVRSGTVSVYSNPDHNARDFDGQPSVVLTRNEQFVYKSEAEVQHTRFDSVSLKEFNVPDTYLTFKETPVSEVFESLEAIYGVNIAQENADIDSCTVTATFTDEPFALKLDLICRSIGLNYRILNDRVMIEGKGCDY